jgi:hypothetical protein
MDGFIPVGSKGKLVLTPPTPRSPAAASVVADRDGKEHRSPWEWLASFKPGYISTRWRRSMKGGFYCAVCHSKDKHLPTKCPMLTDLGLKLVEVGVTLVDPRLAVVLLQQVVSPAPLVPRWPQLPKNLLLLQQV